MNPSDGFIPIPSSLFSMFQREPREYPIQAEVPARIRVAMELLRLFTSKTSSTIAVGQVGSPEEFDGQKLTRQEEDLHGDLCMVLGKYVQGQLPLDNREEPIEREPIGSKEHPGMFIRCFYCAYHGGNHAISDCIFCKGKGELLIFPA